MFGVAPYGHVTSFAEAVPIFEKPQKRVKVRNGRTISYENIAQYPHKSPLIRKFSDVKKHCALTFYQLRPCTFVMSMDERGQSATGLKQRIET
jgi:hypothetical protein